MNYDEIVPKIIDDDKITDDEIDALDGSDLTKLGKKFLDNGNGKLALKCYLRAGELGDNDAFISAAEIYHHGCGDVEPDGQKALELYQKHLSWDANLAIGEIFTEGCGNVAPDGQKALKFYRKLLRGGDGADVWAEEKLLRKIFGKPFSDDDLPTEWRYPYEHYLQALEKIAEIFRYGKGGVPVDGKKALNYYKRVVKTIFGTLDINSLDEDDKRKKILADRELGHKFGARALIHIANMYRDGENIRKSLAKAEKFHEMAADVDHRFACKIF